MIFFRAEVGTIFCLSWLITWYGHVLSDFRSIVRLYDYFIACHPLMPIYMAAAVSKTILYLSFFFGEIHSCIRSLHKSFIKCRSKKLYHFRLFCTAKKKSWHVNVTCHLSTRCYQRYQMTYLLSNLLVMLVTYSVSFHLKTWLRKQKSYTMIGKDERSHFESTRQYFDRGVYCDMWAKLQLFSNSYLGPLNVM